MLNGPGAGGGSGGGMSPGWTRLIAMTAKNGFCSKAPQTARRQPSAGAQDATALRERSVGIGHQMYPNRQSTPSTESSSSAIRSASMIR